MVKTLYVTFILILGILSLHSHNFVTAGMNSLNQQQRRDLILDFYKRHDEKGKPFTIQHFANAGIPRSTVYNILCTASSVEQLLADAELHKNTTGI
jgi:predicted protein tyrosine phosphatase